MDKNIYEAELDAAAKNIVKQALVLEAVADENNIECGPDDLTREISAVAKRAGVDEKKFQEYIYGDTNRLYDMANKVRRRKTLDYLVATMKVTEKAAEEPDEAEEKKAD